MSTQDKVDVTTKNNYYQNCETDLLSQFQQNTIDQDELLENLYLYITPQNMQRLLYIYELYKKLIPLPGVIMQFGVKWGRDLALFDSLRTILEPFNHSRKIYGFDTFKGYINIDSDKDGHSPHKFNGSLTTTDNYVDELDKVLHLREQLSPLNNVKKYQLYAGDAVANLEKHLQDNPHTLVSLAYFDLNLYQPTKDCLQLLKDYMPKGSIIVFDEVNSHVEPGVTLALKEVFDINEINLKRLSNTINPTWPAYMEVGG